MNKKNGFSLLEVTITVVVVGILVTVVFVNMSGSKKNTQEKKFLAELVTILPDVPLCKEAGDNSILTPQIDGQICNASTSNKYPKELPNSNWLYGSTTVMNICTQDLVISDDDFTICAYGEWTNPSQKSSTATKVIKCTRIGCEKLGW